MREEAKLADGRVFWSEDGWKTVYIERRGEQPRLLSEKEADVARRLAKSNGGKK